MIRHDRLHDQLLDFFADIMGVLMEHTQDVHLATNLYMLPPMELWQCAVLSATGHGHGHNIFL